MKHEASSPEIMGQTMANATPAKATMWAVVMATVLLVTFVLPAEYGIDVTGAGRLFGLKTMGERKMAAASSVITPNIPAVTPAIANKSAPAVTQYSTISTLPLRVDEIDVKLAPNGEIEYKAMLPEGESLIFTWDAGGANLEFDFHGEPASGPSGAFLSFHKGIASKSAGSLRAPFTGTHGWYWQNLTTEPVTIRLKTSGYYQSIGRSKP